MKSHKVEVSVQDTLCPPLLWQLAASKLPTDGPVPGPSPQNSGHVFAKSLSGFMKTVLKNLAHITHI